MFGNEMKYDEDLTDNVSGEKVKRIKVDVELIKPLEVALVKNSTAANNFMNISRQVVGLEIQQRDEYIKASEAEKDIQKSVLTLREKMGLDSSWTYNIPMKMMEKREPPQPEMIDEIAEIIKEKK